MTHVQANKNPLTIPVLLFCKSHSELVIFWEVESKVIFWWDDDRTSFDLTSKLDLSNVVVKMFVQAYSRITKRTCS